MCVADAIRMLAHTLILARCARLSSHPSPPPRQVYFGVLINWIWLAVPVGMLTVRVHRDVIASRAMPATAVAYSSKRK